MKRNDAEQIGKLIRTFLRQESLESPLNEQRLINSWAGNHEYHIQIGISG